MIKCLKLLWGNNEQMDSFLTSAFTENLYKIYTDEHCPGKLRIFILTIWKKATVNYQVMSSHLKQSRAIVLCCLQVTELSKDKILTNRDLYSDFCLLRYSILNNLSSQLFNLFTKISFDKYQIARVIVEYLNLFPGNPILIKSILERFKLSNLDMTKREFAYLFQNVKSNSSFNFVWIAFWLGAEVIFF